MTPRSVRESRHIDAMTSEVISSEAAVSHTARALDKEALA